MYMQRYSNTLKCITQYGQRVLLLYGLRVYRAHLMSLEPLHVTTHLISKLVRIRTRLLGADMEVYNC